jgi:uncharacterized membrane protein required for colicin V production
MAYIFDVAIVLLLAFFAWRGASKGLILSLCGLAAVFVAFFAAQFVSDTFCEPVGNILRPIVIQTVRGADAEPEVDPENPEAGYTVDELLGSIQEKGLFEGFSEFLEQAVATDTVGHGPLSPLDALAGYLSKGIAKALLFGLVFIAVQLAWFLVSHALDLAFKLPILAEVNLAGGVIIGFAKGTLLVIVLVWLGQLSGVVPNPPDTPILSLFTVDRLSGLLEGLPG